MAEAFLASGDFASFLGLAGSLPATLTLPTKVNVIFVGFSGEGESTLNVSESQLSPWFQQLRAVQPHAVLPDAGGVRREKQAFSDLLDSNALLLRELGVRD